MITTALSRSSILFPYYPYCSISLLLLRYTSTTFYYYTFFPSTFYTYAKRLYAGVLLTSPLTAFLSCPPGFLLLQNEIRQVGFALWPLESEQY